MQLRGSHRKERTDHRREGDRVRQEGPGEAGGGDQNAGDGRADDARDVDDDAVQADGVGEVIGAGHLHDEALARGVVGDVDEAVEQGQQPDHPEAHGAAGHERPEYRRLYREGRLGEEQHPAFVESVGDQAADGAKEEHRSELQGRREAQVEGAVAELENQPVLGHRLHPGATLGDGLAEEPKAIVARPQGAEHARKERRRTLPA